MACDALLALRSGVFRWLGLAWTGFALASPWATPGAACTQEGANANSNGFLTCTGGVWVAGEAVIGNTSLSCSSATAGALRWSSSNQYLEFCNGTAWNSIGTVYVAGGDPPADCPSVGNTCTDNTIFAGMDGTTPLYTTPCDVGMTWSGSACTGGRSTYPWNNGNGTNYVTTSANSNGADNTALLITRDSDSGTSGTQPHQAAQYCADLILYGHDDWYLPSKNQLNILYGNNASIGNFNTSGTQYWSSTENDTNNAWKQFFSDGNQTGSGKYFTYAVRCVRG